MGHGKSTFGQGHSSLALLVVISQFLHCHMDGERILSLLLDDEH